jgi:hypothetical protein
VSGGGALVRIRPAVHSRTHPADRPSFTLRLGAASLDLAAGSDTPFFGAYLVDAAARYNEGAMAYNAAHGLDPTSPGAQAMVTSDDFAWRGSLVQVTPGLRTSSRGYYFRMEVPIGFGDGARTVGLGLYPINLGLVLGDSVQLHAGAGVAVSWAWFSGTDGSAGGLAQGRLALGAEVGRAGPGALTVELGYTVRALGLLVDRERVAAMDQYDPRTEPLPPADELARGGEQRGMVDLAVGVRF